MAATTASPSKVDQVKGQSQSIQRVLGVPLIGSTLTYAETTINSYSFLAFPYHFGGSIVNTSLKAAEPITSRLAPQLTTVDAWGAAAFDAVEQRVPYPFHVQPQELYEHARAPADNALALIRTYQKQLHQAVDARVYTPAKNVYDARVQPTLDSASARFEQAKKENLYLQRASEIVDKLQTNLNNTLNTLTSKTQAEGDAAANRAQNISNALFAELERVRGFVVSLPAESRKRVGPLAETFNDTFTKLSQEARNTSIPATQRFQNVITYVREKSLPAFQHAIVDGSSTTPNGSAPTPSS